MKSFITIIVFLYKINSNEKRRRYFIMQTFIHGKCIWSGNDNIERRGSF